METKKITRYSNFSSSQIYQLCSKGRGTLTVENVGSGFNTYIKEKRREKKLNRAISNRVYTRPLVWGLFAELYVFSRKLSMDFEDMNNVGRMQHTKYSQWVGIPDTFRRKELVVGDIKNPSSLTKFCDLVENTENGVEAFKKGNQDYYWQLVSNAILTGVDRAEILFYVPYLRDFEDIFLFFSDLILDENKNSLPNDIDTFQLEFIGNEIKSYLENGKLPKHIPFLHDDCEYKDFNQFTFDVPEEDKDFLTERVKMAIDELNKK